MTDGFSSSNREGKALRDSVLEHGGNYDSNGHSLAGRAVTLGKYGTKPQNGTQQLDKQET